MASPARPAARLPYDSFLVVPFSRSSAVDLAPDFSRWPLTSRDRAQIMASIRAISPPITSAIELQFSPGRRLVRARYARRGPICPSIQGGVRRPAARVQFRRAEEDHGVCNGLLILRRRAPRWAPGTVMLLDAGSIKGLDLLAAYAGRARKSHDGYSYWRHCPRKRQSSTQPGLE